MRLLCKQRGTVGMIAAGAALYFCSASPAPRRGLWSGAGQRADR